MSAADTRLRHALRVLKRIDPRKTTDIDLLSFEIGEAERLVREALLELNGPKPVKIKLDRDRRLRVSPDPAEAGTWQIEAQERRSYNVFDHGPASEASGEPWSDWYEVRWITQDVIGRVHGRPDESLHDGALRAAALLDLDDTWAALLPEPEDDLDAR